MSTRIDWQRELDGSFGEAPDRPVADFIAPGRRAVRRRRVAAGVAGLAVAVAMGGVTWATTPGGSPRSEAPVATQGPAPTPEKPAEVRRESQDRAEAMREARRKGIDFLGEPATLDDSGTLVMAPGWVSTETVANPMGYTRPGWRSIGLRATNGGASKFVLISQQVDALSVFSNDAAGGLAAWLTGAVANQRNLDSANGAPGADGSAPGSGTPVRINPDGELFAGPGASIGATRWDVRLPAALRDGTDHAVAAEVLTADGATQWAYATVVGGQPNVVMSTATFADLDAFVAWAAQQYASGAGLR